MGVELDSGKAGLQVVERIVDLLGDLQSVRVRRLLQDEQEAGTAAHDRVADQRLGAVHHVRDVAQATALPLMLSTGSSARSCGCTNGSTGRIPSR